MSEKGLNRGLPFRTLDWAAYVFLLLWSLFDKKLRNNLKQSREGSEQLKNRST